MSRRLTAMAILLGLISSAGCGVSQDDKRKWEAQYSIERVLRDDAQVLTKGWRGVPRVVAEMQSIDLTGCPNDFVTAYKEHIQAWQRMGRVQAAAEVKARTDADGLLVETMIQRLLGNAGGGPSNGSGELEAPATELQRGYQSAYQQIHDTFRRVQYLASRYGANAP